MKLEKWFWVLDTVGALFAAFVCGALIALVYLTWDLNELTEDYLEQHGCPLQQQEVSE